MKVYIKKVIIRDENATPKARGQRLKRLRNLANLSRQYLCDDTAININTYIGWEIGRHGGLPRDGAEKVLARFSAEGVFCSLDWLLFETGTGPYVIPLLKNDEHPSSSTLLKHEDMLILEEIELFKKHFHLTLDCQINDDALEPHFSQGDYVAGVQLPSLDASINEQLFYIVLTASGEKYVRKIKREENLNSFRLSCVNLQSTIKFPVQYDVEVAALAPVMRWYSQSNKCTQSTI